MWRSVRSRKNFYCWQEQNLSDDTTFYRSVTVRVNFLSLDRPDLSFAAGSLGGMKSPTTTDLEELKCVGRHLRGRPVGAISVRTANLMDAGHAGDLGTRKSQSGMEVMWGAHLIKHRGAVQSTIALSSGESEILRVAQVVGPRAPNQSHVERLAVRSGVRDSHALRQECCKRHGCSTGTGEKFGTFCGYKRYSMDVSRCSVSRQDADRCYRCVNFHMRSLGSGRH